MVNFSGITRLKNFLFFFFFFFFFSTSQTKPNQTKPNIKNKNTAPLGYQQEKIFPVNARLFYLFSCQNSKERKEKETREEEMGTAFFFLIFLV